MASIVVMAAVFQLTLGLDRSDAVRVASSAPTMTLRAGVERVRLAVASVRAVRPAVEVATAPIEPTVVSSVALGSSRGHATSARDLAVRGEGSLPPPMA